MLILSNSAFVLGLRRSTRLPLVGVMLVTFAWAVSGMYTEDKKKTAVKISETVFFPVVASECFIPAIESERSERSNLECCFVLLRDKVFAFIFFSFFLSF